MELGIRTSPSSPQQAATTGGSLKAPFPAFGGKSRIAHAVWEALGADVRNYVEPFCFSSAVLLRRPGGPGAVETINDRNAFVTNFWRAVARDPEAVAAHADWPVNEVDLNTRHRWLVTSDEAHARLQAVREDPEAYDARIAGWWCWGACCWIASGWCDETHRNSGSETRPDLEGQMVTAGRWSTVESMHVDLYKPRGVSVPVEKRDKLSGNGVGSGVHANLSEQMPHMDPAGRLALSPPAVTERVPRLTAPQGQGVNAIASGEGEDDGSCARRRRWVTAWMLRLADRMRSVRVCCGHWARVCDSPSTMSRLGTTGVFLDPPYRVTLADGSANRTKHIYANDRHQDVNALCDEVQAWALRWAVDPLVRIALCGLEGEYPEIERLVSDRPGGWRVIEWKSTGGYGNRKGGDSNENRHRERVWLSPHCIVNRDGNCLFG